MGQSNSQNKQHHYPDNTSKGTDTEHKQTYQYDSKVPQQPQQKQGMGAGGPAPSSYPSSLVQQGQKLNRQHTEKSVGVAAERPRPYKVWCVKRETRKSVMASNLRELRKQGASKLGFLWSEVVTVVLECDGTLVEDEAYFQTLVENTIFLLLYPGERWLPPVVQTRQSTNESSNCSSSISDSSSQQSVDSRGLQQPVYSYKNMQMLQSKLSTLGLQQPVYRYENTQMLQSKLSTSGSEAPVNNLEDMQMLVSKMSMNYYDMQIPAQTINKQKRSRKGDLRTGGVKLDASVKKGPQIQRLTTFERELHKSKNAWKPSYKSPNMAGEETEQGLLRKVRGILNKLVPQQFSVLLEQVKSLKFNTEERLKSVVDLVFEKAIDEPNYSSSYANMCKQLGEIRVPLAGLAGHSVSFKKLLITKCQMEFEDWFSFKREQQMKAIKSAENEEKRKILQFEFDKENKKTRYRQLGNIRFIGELFKVNIIIELIIHECIKNLLLQRDEVSLECLCILLETTGKQLHESKPGHWNNSIKFCFSDMQKIVEEPLTSLRVRVMLQDVIDLKKNLWVPKMIDQILKEVETEVQEQQIDLQTVQCNIDSQDRKKDSTGTGQEVFKNEKTPTKDNHKSYSTVDPPKLRLISEPAEVESMHLGLGGSGPSSSAKRRNNYAQKKVYTNSLFASSHDTSHSNQMSHPVREMLEHLLEQKGKEQQTVTKQRIEKKPSITKENLLMEQQIVPMIQQPVAKKPSIMKDNLLIEQQIVPMIQQPVAKKPSITKENLLVEQKETELQTITKKQQAPKVKITPSEAHVNVKNNSVVALKGTLTEEETKKKSNDTIKPLTDESELKEDTEKLKPTNSKKKVQSKPRPNLCEIKKNLDFLLKNSNENEQVLTWITENVPGDQLSEPSFIRALVEVVHKNAITVSGVHCELDAYILRKRGNLLRHYIDYNENLELQALYAVQALFNQLNKPEKILPDIFDVLYSNDVVSEEAFNQWKNSTDPKEQAGKVVALRSTGFFLTYMHNASPEETDED